jgi:hypothetical protein
MNTIYRSASGRNCGKKLIFERNHGLVALAECRNPQEPGVWLSDYHDRAVAINGMATFRQIPLAALSRFLILGVNSGKAKWWR